MGQNNSTLAHPAATQSSPSSSSASPMPSLDDLRDVPHRILVTTNKALGDLGGTIVSIAKPVISSLSGRKGSSVPPAPVLPPPPPPSVLSKVVHWIQKNTGKIILGTVLLSVACVGGSMAFQARRAYQKQMKKLRVAQGPNGSKREIIVVTNVATLDGMALALDLEERGFIVFVGARDQLELEKVLSLGKGDIYPVISEESSLGCSVERLVARVSEYVNDHNKMLLGSHTAPGSESDSLSTVANPAGSTFPSPVFSTSSSFMLVEDDPSVTPPHERDMPQAEAEKHGEKTISERIVLPSDRNEHLFRLSAVIIAPHDSDAGAIESVDADRWGYLLNLNVTGAIRTAQQFLPLLKRTAAMPSPSRSPRLIFITSAITSNISLPNESAACASHHAIASIADSLRREIQHKGIDVVCLKTGIAETSDFSETRRRNNATHAGQLRLFPSPFKPIEILKMTFKQPSTTEALCESAFDAVVSTRPSASQAVGRGSLAYSFVGWAAPSRLLDWSIQRAAMRSFSTSDTRQ